MTFGGALNTDHSLILWPERKWNHKTLWKKKVSFWGKKAQHSVRCEALYLLIWKKLQKTLCGVWRNSLGDGYLTLWRWKQTHLLLEALCHVCFQVSCFCRNPHSKALELDGGEMLSYPSLEIWVQYVDCWWMVVFSRQVVIYPLDRSCAGCRTLLSLYCFSSTWIIGISPVLSLDPSLAWFLAMGHPDMLHLATCPSRWMVVEGQWIWLW